MNGTTQPPYLREKFYGRNRWSVPAAREFTRRAVVAWGVGDRIDEVLLA